MANAEIGGAVRAVEDAFATTHLLHTSSPEYTASLLKFADLYAILQMGRDFVK
jgi:hypothetical protein